MNMMKKNGGFTLVELIVVIAILAILAGVAVPAYSGYIKKAQDAAAIVELDALTTAVQAANAETGAITGISVDADGDTVTLTGTLDTDFLTNFQLFFNDSAASISGNTVTLSGNKIDFAGSSYATSGATWNGSEWAKTVASGS